MTGLPNNSPTTIYSRNDILQVRQPLQQDHPFPTTPWNSAGSQHSVPTQRQKPSRPSTTTIHIGTLNVRKLATDDRLLELQMALKDIHMDILALTELRWKGTDSMD